jgi:DNA mismatch repair ATPase MutS
VATRFIVARLLQTPAIGIITTHDLGIFEAAEISDRVRHAHFAEQFREVDGAERLVFDYRLREGPTTSTNALRLLALIGLTPARDLAHDGEASTPDV